MNRVTTGDLQSITIEVGNELILEDPDFRAEAIREIVCAASFTKN